MNKIETKILVIDPNRSKYGWTENIIAKNIYEVLKNENTLIEYILQHPKTYIYILKYFIQKGLTTKFKKYCEKANWTKENTKTLEYLLSMASKYNRISIFNYLIEKFNQYFDFSKYENVQYYVYNKDDLLLRHYDILDYCAKQFVFKNNLHKIDFSTLAVFGAFVHSENNPLINQIHHIILAYASFNEKTNKMSFEEIMSIFNYEMKRS